MWRLETLVCDILKELKPELKTIHKEITTLKGKEDAEILEYVYRVVRPVLDKLPSADMRHQKSNEKADLLRKEGNEIFLRESNFLNALECYSRAVAHAEIGSENLCMAYSNRSHLLFQARYYDECLKDIDRALQCSHSENIKEKLIMRKKKAEELRPNRKVFCYCDPPPEIKSKNKSIEAASSSIGFNKDEKLGLHIVANKDIKLGEVLAVEDPYIAVLNMLSKYEHCSECLKTCYNMIPCENCTEVLYCDEDCRDRAYKLYHKYKCPLIQRGFDVGRTFLKLTLKSVQEYNQLLKDLAENDNTVYKSNRYKELYNRDTSKYKKKAKDLLEHILEPVVYYHYLTNYTNFLEDLTFENKDAVLKNLLVKNYWISMSNNLGIEKLTQNYVCATEFEPVGIAVYPFCSQLLHSCFPNAMPVFYGSKIVLRALVNIKKGEHVTICYGITFTNSTKKERQSDLLAFYNYKCQCEACEQNWPRYEHLKSGSPIPKTYFKKLVKVLGAPEIDRDRVNQLIEATGAVYESIKVTGTPTLSMISFRLSVADLLLCTGNRVVI